MKAEWGKAPDFHEYAEALGITTRQIMGVKAGGGKETIVLFSPDVEDDLDPETPIFATPVARDHDDIVKVVGETTMLSITWGEMQRELDRRMEGLGR